MLQLLKDCKIVRVANAAGAAQTAVTGSTLDLAGWDGVCYVAALGDVADTSVLTLTAYSDTASAMSSEAAHTTTATHTADATDADNKLLVLDVIRPTKRYHRVKLTRTTANAVVDGIFAILYRGKKAPVTADTTIVASGVSVGVA